MIQFNLMINDSISGVDWRRYHEWAIDVYVTNKTCDRQFGLIIIEDKQPQSTVTFD